MRISDWSSDVCSSDLLQGQPRIWMADPPHRVPELSPFGHRRDLWGARLAYSSGVPIIEMVAKANISRIAQTDLVYRQAIPGEMQRVLTIIRSEEHTSELQSLMRISYAVFCLKNKKKM